MLKSTSFPLISCDHKKHMAIQCLRYIIGYKNGIFLSRRKGNASESGRQHFHWFTRRYFLFISDGLCTLSLAVPSMWPCKNISHIQVLVIYFLPTPRIKLKLGVQIGGETTNSKPPGPIIMISQSRRGSSSHQIIFITLFSLAGVNLCDAFYQPQQTVPKCWAKIILLSQTHRILTFLRRVLVCRVTYWALVELLSHPSLLIQWRKLPNHCATPPLRVVFQQQEWTHEHNRSLWLTASSAIGLGKFLRRTLDATRQEERADGKSFNQNWRKIE